MIQIKLSPGARPGQSGILPAQKFTAEVAAISLVKERETVFSPPYQSAFSTPKGLMLLVKQLKELSNGKPIGFKLGEVTDRYKRDFERANPHCCNTK